MADETQTETPVNEPQVNEPQVNEPQAEPKPKAKAKAKVEEPREVKLAANQRVMSNGTIYTGNV